MNRTMTAINLWNDCQWVPIGFVALSFFLCSPHSAVLTLQSAHRSNSNIPTPTEVVSYRCSHCHHRVRESWAQSKNVLLDITSCSIWTMLVLSFHFICVNRNAFKFKSSLSGEITIYVNLFEFVVLWRQCQCSNWMHAAFYFHFAARKNHKRGTCTITRSPNGQNTPFLLQF